jgi:sensor histidine kinase YesM
MANYIAELSAKRLTQQYVDEMNKSILYEKAEKAEIEKNLMRMELRNFQMQMSPHFFFNILNTINNLVILEKPQEASEIISSLSALLRRSLYRSEKPMISLKDEWDAILNYHYIRELAHKNEVIKLQAKIDENCLNARIPPFSLQIFVENAYVKGLEPKEGGGTVTVEVSRERNRVNILVGDDGIGMNKEEYVNLMNIKSHPLKETGQGSVACMLKTLLYNFEDEFQWDITTRLGHGTKFFLSFPYQRYTA